MYDHYPKSYLNQAGVYSITNTFTNKRYIGSTKNFLRRFSSHKSMLKGNFHDNKNVQEAYNSHPEYFIFEVVEVSPVDKLLEKEQFWMDKYEVLNSDKGFNIGTSSINPMLGNTHTPEARKKISEKAKKRVMSEETKDKIRSTLTGVPKNRSVRNRCVSHKPIYITKNPPEKERHIVNQYKAVSPEGTEHVFDNLKAFCREHSLTPSHFYNCLKKGTCYKGWSGSITRVK